VVVVVEKMKSDCRVEIMRPGLGGGGEEGGPGGGVRWSFFMPYFYHDKVEKEKGV